MSKTIRLLLKIIVLASLIAPLPAAARAQTPPVRSAGSGSRDAGPISAGVAPAADPVSAIGALVAGAEGMTDVAPVDNWSRLSFQRWSGASWDLYAADANGSNLRQLTKDASDEARPRQSHLDGRIAFVSDRTGNFDIFTMDPDGGNQRQITADPKTDDYPAWSPDGTRIAFASTRSGTWDVYLMNADGSAVTRLAGGSATEYSPAWSPDGSMIAWIQASGEYGRVWVARTDGTDARSVSRNLRYLDNLAWSPDSLKIAFSYANDYLTNDLFTDIGQITLNGSTEPFLLLECQYQDTDALIGSYSPDGEHILVSLVKYVVENNELKIAAAALARKQISDYHHAWELPTILTQAGYEMLGDWQRTDFTPPISWLDRVPALSRGSAYLSWSSYDRGGSGVEWYEFEHRIGDGPWELNSMRRSTVANSFTFPVGTRVAFRMRAIDAAGNAEPWSSAPYGAGQTFFYGDRFVGKVFDSRETPIAGARLVIAGNPGATFVSAADGSYDAYSVETIRNLQARHPAYGTLPSIFYNNHYERYDLALPPKVNAVANGGFEEGYVNWNAEGMVGLDATGWASHSGDGSMRLGALATAIDSRIAQTITIPPASGHPTLSFFVKRFQRDYSLDRIHVTVGEVGKTPVELSLNRSDADLASHFWADLTPWGRMKATLTFIVDCEEGAACGEFYFDEISVGEWHTPRITRADALTETPGTLTIHGENFEPDAAAQLDDAALPTRFVDSQTLTVEIAGDVKPGIHDLWVTNPGGEQAQGQALIGKPLFLPILGTAE